MNYSIVFDKSFEKEVKRLSKRYPSLKSDLIEFQEEIYANPQIGTDLGNGLRKIRMRISSKGRGKSGGARVISFTVVVAIDETEINLLYIYDKAERESISLKAFFFAMANSFPSYGRNIFFYTSIVNTSVFLIRQNIYLRLIFSHFLLLFCLKLNIYEDLEPLLHHLPRVRRSHLRRP